MQKFNDRLLAEFADSFYGYGNYQGDYWFIGMEEGGGDSFEEIENRLIGWQKRGCKELEDIYEYHLDVGPKWFIGSKPVLQPTWRGLIRLLLSIEGLKPDPEMVRDYQKNQLGRETSNNCLLEILPLPSPSTSKWLYGNHSDLPQLASREAYKRFYFEVRATHIRQKIAEYNPKIVVFYSINPEYMNFWKTIAGVEFAEHSLEKHSFFMGKRNQTSYLVTRHPTAFHTSSDYFHSVGAQILAQ